MLESQTINIQYIPQNKISGVLAALDLKTTPLLLLDHSQQASILSAVNPPLIHTQSGLDSICSDTHKSWCELWTARGLWKQGSYSASLESDTLQSDTLYSDTKVSYCSNDEYVIGSISIPLAVNYSLQELSQVYYEQILRFISTQNKPHLLRMWNYFPDINGVNKGFERYQQFCVGRHLAFSESSLLTSNSIQYPAASAVGSHSSTMVIIFIATRKAGLFLENPDQISAYRYPSHYSPKSPSFARASVYQNQGVSQLYISGTASIVGHESLFHGDMTGQTQQTIKNLQRLIEHTNHQKGIIRPFGPYNSKIKPPAIKVYLRKPGDMEAISSLIQEFSPHCDNICYLQADICRQELDIEIEMLLNA